MPLHTNYVALQLPRVCDNEISHSHKEGYSGYVSAPISACSQTKVQFGRTCSYFYTGEANDNLK